MTRLPFRTLAWEGSVDGRFVVLDQRLLPGETKEIVLNSVGDVYDAIKTLAVRGAPALGAAAAYGLVVAARAGTTTEDVRRCLREGRKLLASSRPTAHNLFWGLDRVARADDGKERDRTRLLECLLREAQAIEQEDAAACEAIGCHGAPLLPDPVHAITQCNAGALATCGIGSALAPIYLAHAAGRAVKVIARETRPLLQGARLTAWELSQAGIEVTVIADGAAAHMLARGKANCAIVGADRIARNGDTANKIGTYGLALAAQRHRIPFFVAAPTSTFDPTIASGAQIEIEERSGDEVAFLLGALRAAPEGVPCANPAFDVTPGELITAIITEKGVARPPFERTIAALLGN